MRRLLKGTASMAEVVLRHHRRRRETEDDGSGMAGEDAYGAPQSHRRDATVVLGDYMASLQNGTQWRLSRNYRAQVERQIGAG